jgi:ligand-binding SRPBCC domain-containing protein
MPTITITTHINAPVECCFDLSRSIDLHTGSMAHTGETAIAGRTHGLIGPGETVTWRAKHLGIWQTLTSKVTDFNSPTFFADEMVSGAFKSFRHEHHFQQQQNGQTLMTDIFTFDAPFGILGRIANFLFLKRYMINLLQTRNQLIKQTAERKQD